MGLQAPKKHIPKWILTSLIRFHQMDDETYLLHGSSDEVIHKTERQSQQKASLFA